MKQLTPRKPPDICNIRIQGGFLKHVCREQRYEDTMRTLYKCHNSEEFYWDYLFTETHRSIFRVTNLCPSDTHVYQVCGTRLMGEINNSDTLCGSYLCELTSGRIFTTVDTINKGIHCNGQRDCVNTDIDEKECSEQDFDNKLITMPSGRVNISSTIICDGVCSLMDCEDEANCNGYNYGLYCKIDFGRLGYPSYRPLNQLCDGIEECTNGEDEANCTVTSDTEYTCERDALYSWEESPIIVPILNVTRCAQLISDEKTKKVRDELIYCNTFAPYQTNCSDPDKVGLKCPINGYMSTVSKFMICLGEQACDDNIENQCFDTSTTCFVHKHSICDGKDDCNDKSDETNLNCYSVAHRNCSRRLGQTKELSLPLSWLRDGVEDCVDGIDEKDIWPTCGKDQTLRFVTGDKKCQNVYLCQWDEPGYVQLSELCDGVETCGNENEVCSKSRNSQVIPTTVLSADKGLTKHLSHCIKGIQNSQNFNNTCKSIPTFIFPDHQYFGVDTRTTVILPKYSQSCDNMFGEQYLYTSCTGSCVSALCPLRNVPRYEVCPGQYHKRIGTIANNEYLAFFTKSFGSIYTNRYFVCDNKIKCIDYSKVCNLADDCGDGSDEASCTNHFKCNESGYYIPKTSKCDGSFDCMDLSDECNGLCSREIVEGVVLKISSWVIGFLAVLANVVIIAKNAGPLKNCKTTVALLNRSLIMMISLGDLLVGGYLFVISIYDGIIFKTDYCTRQIGWITSTNCSVIGVLSTIGSQVSLFAMCILSTTRIHGIASSMRIPGEVTLKKSIQVAASLLMITLASMCIAIVPIIDKFEDFFVNGIKFADQLKILMGTPNKEKLLSIFQAYYGRMKDATLSWRAINAMAIEMFSHDHDYQDHTTKITKVDFYGNDGVCLFKYFVKGDDPQRNMVWAILALNFVCFILITVSYMVIGIISLKSSKKLTQSGGNKQITQRNRKMNLRISIIITTDFVCWVPFIVVCVLHSLEVLDATPWYGLFSIVVLPINSVINPLIYDDTVTHLIGLPVQRLGNLVTDSRAYRGSIAARLVRSVRPQQEPIEMDCGENGKRAEVVDGKQIRIEPLVATSEMTNGLKDDRETCNTINKDVVVTSEKIESNTPGQDIVAQADENTERSDSHIGQELNEERVLED